MIFLDPIPKNFAHKPRTNDREKGVALLIITNKMRVNGQKVGCFGRSFFEVDKK